MYRDPILIIGGAGIVGCWASRFLREAHPDVPLLVAGRNRAAAERAAAAVGCATAVAIDMASDDLGLGARRVSAVATLFTDGTGAALRYAQRRGVGHVSISPGIIELGPEVAAFMHAPRAAPVVLGTEWLVGATSVPTLAFAEAFGRLDAIVIGALLDEQDAFGPAAQADLERQTKTMTAALARVGGFWTWRDGEDARSTVRSVDGVAVEASAFSPNDVLALANATGAANVRFDLALGTSSSRRAGGSISTEIVIDLAGWDHAGRPLRTRHAIVHPGGQMPLTGLGVALVLERLAGLAGPPVPPGLYFPSQLIDRATYSDRLRAAGGRILDLDPAP